MNPLANGTRYEKAMSAICNAKTIVERLEHGDHQGDHLEAIKAMVDDLEDMRVELKELHREVTLEERATVIAPLDPRFRKRPVQRYERAR